MAKLGVRASVFKILRVGFKGCFPVLEISQVSLWWFRKIMQDQMVSSKIVGQSLEFLLDVDFLFGHTFWGPPA